MNEQSIEAQLAEIRRRLDALEERETTAETIECKSLHLRDASGRIRAVLRVTDNGDPTFALADADGNPKLMLATSDGETFIAMHGRTTDTRAKLKVLDSGAADLQLEQGEHGNLLHIGSVQSEREDSFGITILEGDDYRMAWQLRDRQSEMLLYAPGGNGLMVTSSAQGTSMAWLDAEGRQTKVISEDE